MARKTTSRTGPVSARPAFTLLEIIIVMVLMAVVLGVAAPSMRGFSRARKETDAAACVLAMTRLARSIAVTAGAPSRLNCDAMEGRCWVTVQQAGEFVELGTDIGRPLELPLGMNVQVELPEGQERRDYVEFQPDGRSEQATIWLISDEGRTWQVCCPTPTDRFRVVKPTEGRR